MKKTKKIQFIKILEVFMKRIILLSIALSMLFTVNTFAADESFDATITILPAVSITEVKGLTFGDVLSTNASQTVTIDGDNVDTRAAHFTVTGHTVQANFSVLEASIVMTFGGGADITVNAFTISQASAILSGADTDVYVGGTATINADQVAGTYTGAATFQAIYN
jgi:hypothetical protein